MKYDPKIHHRRSIRLREFDYSQPGAYFVTMVAHDRMCLFGGIVDDAMSLNDLGRCVEATWADLPNHNAHVLLDAFIVMPNHVHGIIVLDDNDNFVRAGSEPAPTTHHGLPEIIRQLKTFSARRINEIRHTPGEPVWQRNYYERVIRDDDEWNHIRKYIACNPGLWADDSENPNNQSL